MKCRKCGSENMGVMPNKKNPSATDLYCLDCGAWQKFATKDEIRLYQCKKEPITNADRLRAMSDEELAAYLAEISGGTILKAYKRLGLSFSDEKSKEYLAELTAECLKRLQSPVEEDV